MRLFVKIESASMICAADEQYPIKGQVVDVPDSLGASLLSYDEYEVYVGQVKLHKDFVASDKESDKVTAQAEVERLAQEAKDAEAEEKRLADEAAESERLEKEAADAEEQRLADEEAQAAIDEANKTNESTP